MILRATLMPPYDNAVAVYENVEEWELRDGALVLTLADGRELYYNWTQVRIIEVTP